MSYEHWEALLDGTARMVDRVPPLSQRGRLRAGSMCILLLMVTLTSGASAQTSDVGPVLDHFQQALDDTLNSLGNASVDLIQQDRAGAVTELVTTVGLAQQLVAISQAPEFTSALGKRSSSLKKSATKFLTSLNKAQAVLNKETTKDKALLSALTKASGNGRKVVKSLLKVPGIDSLVVLEEVNASAKGFYGPGQQVSYRVHAPGATQPDVSIVNFGDAIAADAATWTSASDFYVITGPAAGGARVTVSAANKSSTLPLINTGRLQKGTVPNAPSDLAATAVSSSGIELRWVNRASNTSGFQILQSLSTNGPWTQIALVGPDEASYMDTGLVASTTYYYHVQAYNSAGTSTAADTASATTTSTADTVPPTPPTGLTTTAVSANQINLTWSGSTDSGGSGLAGYKVYRGGVQIATTTATTYSSSGLSAGTQYCYTVAAYDAAGNTSASSSSACATTLASIPAAPSNLQASAVATNQINLSWTDNATTETGFKVERATSASGPWTQIGTTAAGVSSYSSSGLTASTTYYYRVRATNSAGDSAYSAVASATTPAAPDTTPPSVPTGLTATAASTNQINLTWSGSTDSGGSGLVGYKVYRGGVQIATSATTNFTNTGLSPSTQYCYTVAAYDNAGNTSSQSSSACATTQSPADKTAPTVSMTAPTGGSLVKATITVSANASDNLGVTKVEFYRDSGVLLATDTATPYSISLDTTTLSNGSHSLYAKAYDAAGNTGTASSVTITVDNAAPTVSLTSPANSTTVSNTIAIAAAATDNVAVAKVELYRDSAILLGTYITAPYSMTFDTTAITNGTHSIYAKAYDAVGNSSFSSASQVTVNNTTTSASGAYAWGIVIGSTNTALATGIAADTNGNVIVAGVCRNTADFGGGPLAPIGNQDVFVAKYTSAGGYLWAKRFGDSVNHYPQAANAVAVDKSGNVIVVGTVSGSIDFGGGVLTGVGSGDIFIAKFSPTGQVLWSKLVGGAQQDAANAVATDGQGNVFVVGYYGYGLTGTPGSIDFGGGQITSTSANGSAFVAKYTSSGQYVWTRSLGSSSGSAATGVVADGSGNVVLTGAFSGAGNFGGQTLTSAGGTDIFLAQYASDGSHNWSQRFGGTSGDTAEGVAVDGSGNVAITGSFAGTVDFGGGGLTDNGHPNIFLAKFSSSGLHRWSKAFSSYVDFGDQANSVGMDSAGNVVIAGKIVNAVDFGTGLLMLNQNGDVFVAKFSASGGALWAKRFGGPAEDYASAVSLDGGGNTLFTGQFYQSIDFGGGQKNNYLAGFIAKFGP